MPPSRKSMIDALLVRAGEAARAAAASTDRSAEASGTAERLHRRTRLLRDFVRRGREDRARLLRRCAWCGRVQVGGDEFVAPEEFLDGELPERDRERATHSICPDCLDREQRNADTTRAARRRRPEND